MKAADWIDRVKARKGWESDYRVAKELGFRPNTISMYRSHGGPMDEAIAIKVANALEINPAGVVIDQAAERAKDAAIRAALFKVSGDLCILCKLVAASVFGGHKRPRLHHAA